MSYLVVCSVALFASALTFYSGFGLGTLLLPAFALFFPVEQAIALTAIVHFLNGLFKIGLVGRHANRRVLFRFGLPALITSILGAWALVWLSGMAPTFSYYAFGRLVTVTPVKFIVGLLLLVFALLELLPRFRGLAFDEQHMPMGGMLSGFFGGLSGMQGALRSAFLSRAKLSKEEFIATGVLIACFIDVSRLAVYYSALAQERAVLDYKLLTAAVLAAFLGATLGNQYLKKMTMPNIQRIVSGMLFAVALGLITGFL